MDTTMGLQWACMFSRGRTRPVFTMVAVFLVGLLASRPAVAENGKNAAAGPSASPPAPANPSSVTNPGLAGSESTESSQTSGGVFVEVKSSSRPVRIDRLLGPGMAVPVCVSPCRQVLPRDGVYVITGDRVRATAPFVLPDDRDRVVLDVQPGSSGNATAGKVTAGAGLVAMVLGFGFVLKSDLNSMGSDSDRSDSKGPGKMVGGLMILGGVMAGIVGICLMVGGRTTVTSSAGAHFTETPAPKRSRLALTARGLEF
jgi:hypothetical protein